MTSPHLIVTCEHAVDDVPAAYRRLPTLAARRGTHWAYDPGAQAVAQQLARAFGAPLVAGTISRLLVDLNRSPHHPRVLSDAARRLNAVEQTQLRAHHEEHWQAVARAFARGLQRHRRILHVAVHSFTPAWPDARGVLVPRTADVGLLYDPARDRERVFAHRWQATLKALAPALRVRRNYPYLGRSDGLATATRRRLAPSRYLGFELELNQASLLAHGDLPMILIASLRKLLSGAR